MKEWKNLIQLLEALDRFRVLRLLMVRGGGQNPGARLAIEIDCITLRNSIRTYRETKLLFKMLEITS